MLSSPVASWHAAYIALLSAVAQNLPSGHLLRWFAEVSHCKFSFSLLVIRKFFSLGLLYSYACVLFLIKLLIYSFLYVCVWVGGCVRAHARRELII